MLIAHTSLPPEVMSITCLVLSISTTTPDAVLWPTGRAVAIVSAFAVA